MHREHSAGAAIRRSRDDDLDSVSLLIEPFVRRRKLLPRSRDELQRLLPFGFVAESDGRLAGFAAVEIYSSRLAEIQCLAVSEASRGLGIGKLLVEACVEEARARGVGEVMAISSSDEFFKSCGFDYALPEEKKAFFIQLGAHRR